jgi:S-adenosyl-L-methionine hydrolase (adenosine-forming)
VRNVVLLTDFGTRDPYVAAMKGVIASRTDVPIVDLSHDIAPFAVFEAAWFLRAVLPYWRDAVFVCVVDPGVGTARRILAMREGTNVLLAPDNGLLSLQSSLDIRSLENESLFLPNGSTTFHGRDRFAPVAAGLANGMSLDDVGPRVEAIVRLPYEEPAYGADKVTGTIVSVDRFGNAITDIVAAKMPFAIHGLRETYTGEGTFPIVGSTGCVEFSMAGASAAHHLHLRPLDRVELWPNDVAFSRSSS